MTVYDWVFWWTGFAAWAVVSIVFAAALLLAGVLGFLWFRRVTKHYLACHFFAEHEIDKRRVQFAAIDAFRAMPMKHVTAEQVCNFVVRLRAEYIRLGDDEQGE